MAATGPRLQHIVVTLPAGVRRQAAAGVALNPAGQHRGSWFRSMWRRPFGRSAAFGVFGLWLFGFIGYPILGFGSARYLGRPDAAPAA